MLSHTAVEPHAHHLELAEAIADDVRRNLVRMGMMRGLTVARLGASGAYSLSLLSAEQVRPSTLDGFGVGLADAIGIVDDVLDYDPATEAAVLIVETNPIDGALVTFLVQELATA